MPEFRVVWEIDVEAEDARAAAAEARSMQLDENSIATVFTVHRMDAVETVDTDAQHVLATRPAPAKLTRVELATVLAGLRLWQAVGLSDFARELRDIASEAGAPLSVTDIGALCEKLNFGCTVEG